MLSLVRRALASTMAVVFTAAMLFGCGGGGGGGNSPPPPASRPGLLFGYFTANDSQVAETAGHTNLMLEGLGGQASVIARMSRAQQSTILSVTWQLFGGVEAVDELPNGDAILRRLFQDLQRAGVLTLVKAIYPMDEPDVNGVPAERLLSVNRTVRRVASEFPELEGVKLMVLYGPRTFRPNGAPAISDFDWVGFDNYPSNASIFVNGEYDEFRAQLRPGQRIFLVPGGASPWKQDIGPFYAVAQNDPLVLGILAFIWYDGWGENAANVGIKSNGRAHEYCATGRVIVGTTGPC